MSKKILCSLLAALAAVGMTACGSPAPSAASSQSASSEASVSEAAPSESASESAEDMPIDGMPSPMDEYDSLPALREAVGFEPLDIAEVAGYTDVGFYSINKEIAQIIKKNDAGTELNLRAAKGNEDISGVMGAVYTEKTMDLGEVKGVLVNIGTMEDVFVAWFNVNDMTYAVSAQGGDITQENFEVLLPYLVW